MFFVSPARIVLFVFALAAAGCGKKPAAPPADAKPAAQTIRFALDWYPQPEQGGYYDALFRGYYAAAGLNVEILPGHPNGTADRRVATGEAQIGMSASDTTLINHERGLPLIAIAATFQHDPLCIIVHAESPVHGFADLSNRRMSVAPGIPWFRYLVAKFHIQNVQEIPVTYTPATFIHDPTYIQQGFVTSEPYFIRKQGVEPRVLMVSDSGYDAYRVLISTRDFVAKNPDAVRRFVAASQRGWDDYMKDPSLTDAEILKLNPEKTPELMHYSWQALKDGHYIEGFPEKGDAGGRMTAPRWQAQYDMLRQAGVIAGAFDPKEAYTLDFLPPP